MPDPTPKPKRRMDAERAADMEAEAAVIKRRLAGKNWIDAERERIGAERAYHAAAISTLRDELETAQDIRLQFLKEPAMVLPPNRPVLTTQERLDALVEEIEHKGDGFSNGGERAMTARWAQSIRSLIGLAPASPAREEG